MDNIRYFDAAEANRTAEETRANRREQKFDKVAHSDFFNQVISEIKAQAVDGNNNAAFTPMPEEFYAEKVADGRVPSHEECHFSAEDKEVFDVLESMMGYKIRFENGFPALFADPHDEPFKVSIDYVNVYW